MSDELLTTAQAAERLGCAVSTVKKLIKEGRLIARKLGHILVINAADLDGVTIDTSRGWVRGRSRKPPAPED